MSHLTHKPFQAFDCTGTGKIVMERIYDVMCDNKASKSTASVTLIQPSDYNDAMTSHAFYSLHRFT